MPLGEVFQDSRTIVADGGQLQALRLKSLFCVLQLHELRFAEGSPVGRAEEKEYCAIRPLERLVGLHMAELIGQNKSRCWLADFQADRWSNSLISG